MKLKLARFGSWPSLCADVDSVVVERRGGRSRKRLIKTRSINEPNSMNTSFTETLNGNDPVINGASSNFEKIDGKTYLDLPAESSSVIDNSTENQSQTIASDTDVLVDVVDGCQPPAISDQIRVALIENLHNFCQSTTTTTTTTTTTDTVCCQQPNSIALLDSTSLGLAEKIDTANNNSNHSSASSCVRGKEEKICKLELQSCCNILESPPYLSIIEEKDESLTESHRCKEESSVAVDNKNPSELFETEKRRSAPTANSLLHRLSVPDMATFVSRCRSASTQDVSTVSRDVDDTADSETDGDYFDENDEDDVLGNDEDDVLGNDDDADADARRQSIGNVAAFYKRRNVSVSSLILNRHTNAEPLATERRRVSHCAGENFSRHIHANGNADNADARRPLVHPSAAALKANFNRSMSASTPSINDMIGGGNVKLQQNVAISAGTDTTQKNAEGVNETNTGIDQEFSVVQRNNKVKHTRTPSLYVPSITPRLPLMGLLPGSVRRPSEKSSDGKIKDKEKRSFFRPRTKSKEKKPHSWIKVVCSNSDICEMCTKPLANTDAYQCNECLASVHSQCKDQIEKTSCAKIKHPKTSKSSSHLSMSFPEKPKNLVNRYSSLKIDPVLTHRSDSTQNLLPVDDKINHNNNFPPGFFASSKLNSLWDDLNLWIEEPEAWSATVGGKAEKKKLSSKAVKRQDIIHELYVTEKHHCQILVVLKHTYFDGIAMQKILPVDDLHKLLPGLDNLLNVHFKFLRLLKQRKDEAPVVDLFHDILLEQFTGETASLMIDTYTKFCSQKDSTDRTFQELYQNNLHYQNFVKSISSSAFYKSRSLCDCLLLVTQRLSKYHSFVESIRKHTLDDCLDKEGISLAEKAVKDVVKAVDSGIERIQLQQFRINIAREIDPKSSVPFDKTFFSAKDLVSENRSLLYYAEVQWPNAKRHTAAVLLLLFSDVIVFVQRNGGQYNFFSQDGKASVVSVRKMIVRDKAGKLGSDGVYLIATYPKPEMYEVRCKTRKENVHLMSRIQKAVDRHTNENVVQEEVIEKPSLTLMNGKEVLELKELFDKLPDVHKNLLSHYDELLNIYESISNYINKLAPKIKNNEDKEKIASVVSTCMDSYLNIIHPDSVAMNLFGGIAKEKLRQQIASLHYEDSESSSNSVCSIDNAVLRSHTFHGRLGSSIRRKALRKHPTISGVSDVDVRASVGHSQAVVEGSSCESIGEEQLIPPIRSNSCIGPVKDVTFCLLKHLADTKVEVMRLRENNARLECELALANDQLQQRSKQTAVVDNNYQRLEELRNLHASFDKKKTDYLQDVEDKKLQLNKRERALDEREADLQRRDDELHERWSKLVHVWEQQRVNGLPVSPLISATAPATAPNGELRRAYSVLSPSSNTVSAAQQQLYAERIQQAQQQHQQQQQQQHQQQQHEVSQTPAGRQQHSSSPNTANVIPGHLQGSLVHGRYADEAPKTVLPVKLIKEYSVSESLSSKFNALGRSSHKKKSHSTSKLTTTPVVGQQQQMIPNKLVSNVGTSKKK